MATKKTTTNPYGLTDENLKELHELAQIEAKAERAAEIRKRFKAFIDDHSDELKEGIEVDGLGLTIKLSKKLVVEEL